MNTNINDLPDDTILVEIFYLLDRYKSVAQCKCVSKRRCNLMSHPSFVGAFLSRLKGEHSPIHQHSLLHSSGVEFLGRLSSSTEPLTQLFERIMSVVMVLETKPDILGNYNDLILCSVSMLDQHDYFVYHDYYFICNPSTIQCVPIPPPPQVYKHKYTPVGFICDLPYCNFRSTGDQGGSMFHPNAEYRCRVVRIMCHEYQMLTLLNEFKAQIFSSETGEWIETIVSFPSPFCFVHMIHFISYANKGKLYWGGHTNGVENFLIGLNPFAINKRNNTSLSSTNIIDQTNSCFTALGQNANQGFRFWPLGVYKGCLQMYRYDSGTRNLYVVDLNDEQVRLDQIWKNYSKS